jgi:oligopeptide/dipeptide ABC transporter ATP-binding protein
MPAASAMPTPDDVVLDVVNLHVSFPGAENPIRSVRGVSLTVHRSEAVGIVGESGSGKSVTALAIAQLVQEPGDVVADRLRFLGEDLLRTDAERQRKLLGTSMAMVFQDPMTSFNPTKRMGGQLAEVATQHQNMSRRDALAKAIDRLGAVKLTDPERRAAQYPHEFSGGMRQRAMIGMGLMSTPSLIIADEPTTALDVTVQKQVLDLLQSIRRRDDIALLLISHDVSVVAEICDRVLVMYAGRIVEDLPSTELANAKHPYTRALLAAVPDMETDLQLPLATVPGRAADPSRLPAGCAYAARCPLADDHCRTVDPGLVEDVAGRRVACWHASDVVALGIPLVRDAADVEDIEDVEEVIV